MDNYDRYALLPCPAGPAAAVNINFIIIGKIKVNHVRKVIHIQPPCGHIRGDQNLQLTVPKSSHHLIPLHLGQIPVEGIRIIAVVHKLIGYLFRLTAGPAKNDTIDPRININDAFYHFVAILGIHHIIDVLDIFCGDIHPCCSNL